MLARWIKHTCCIFIRSLRNLIWRVNFIFPFYFATRERMWLWSQTTDEPLNSRSIEFVQGWRFYTVRSKDKWKKDGFISVNKLYPNNFHRSHAEWFKKIIDNFLLTENFSVWHGFPHKWLLSIKLASNNGLGPYRPVLSPITIKFLNNTSRFLSLQMAVIYFERLQN